MLKRTEALDFYEVRNMCIENNFYTCGSCEDYDRMLARCSSYENAADKDYELEQIATDIVLNSNDEVFSQYGFDSYDEKIEYVAYTLINDCMRMYVEIS